MKDDRDRSSSAGACTVNCPAGALFGPGGRPMCFSILFDVDRKDRPADVNRMRRIHLLRRTLNHHTYGGIHIQTFFLSDNPIWPAGVPGLGTAHRQFDVQMFRTVVDACI